MRKSDVQDCPADYKKIAFRCIRIVLMVAVVVFIALSLFWYLSYERYYKSIEKNVAMQQVDYGDEEKLPGTRYDGVVNGCTCVVKEPSFLCYGGFVSIQADENLVVIIDEEGNPIGSEGMTFSLFLWPKKFGRYKYGFSIRDWDTSELIIVDAEGNYIENEELDDEENERLRQFAEQYKDELLPLLETAKILINGK